METDFTALVFYPMLVSLGGIFWVGAQLWHSFILQLWETDDQAQDAINQQMERRFEHIFSLPVLFVLLLTNVGVFIEQEQLLASNHLDQASISLVNSRFGTYWLLSEIVILLAIALCAFTLFAKQYTLAIKGTISWANLVLGLALLITIVLTRHATTLGSSIAVYAVLLDWLQLLAASLWIGGMIYITAIYLPVLKNSPLLERTRSLLTTLPHFSPLAIVGIIIVSITGLFNAIAHLSSWEQLYTTTYGRILLVAILLMASLLLTGVMHVGLFRPRLAKSYQRYLSACEQEHTTSLALKQQESLVLMQARRLTNSLRWEPLLGIAVLVCTGLMSVLPVSPSVTAAPPAPPIAPSKPFSTTLKTTDNKLTIKLDVTPNHFGTNTFTVTVLNSSGIQDTNVGVSAYITMLDMDMGTDTISLQPDGQGHFSARRNLNMGGNWQIRIQVRTPDHTFHEVKVRIFTPF